MALAEFLRNVQTARNIVLLHLYHLKDHPDAARIPTDLARLRAAAPLWLSPRVARAFDPLDAPLLTDRGEELASAVAEYHRAVKAVAEGVPTDEQLHDGLRALSRVAVALGETISEPEGQALLAALLKSAPLPAFVLGFDYTLDTDATGDPAVWLWVIVPDDLDPDSAEFRDFAAGIRKWVWRALGAIKSERLPYIHYRPLSEAVEVMSGSAA